MPSVRKSKCDLPITRNLIAEWKVLGSTPGERPLKKLHQEWLRNTILSGAPVTPFTWIKSFCKETTRWYRIDGQHSIPTLDELVDDELQIVIDNGGIITETVYDCDTLEDVIILYNQMNPRKSARSAVDLHVAIRGHTPLHDLPVEPTQWATKGINFLFQKIEKVPNLPTGDEATHILKREEPQKFAKWFATDEKDGG